MASSLHFPFLSPLHDGHPRARGLSTSSQSLGSALVMCIAALLCTVSLLTVQSGFSFSTPPAALLGVVGFAAARDFPAPMQALCEGKTLTALTAYTLNAADTHFRTIYTRACNFNSGVTFISSSTTVPITNALIYILDTKVSGAFTINLVLGKGSYLNVISANPVGAAPSLILRGSLLGGAEIGFQGSHFGEVTTSMIAKECSKTLFLSSVMSQLTVETGAQIIGSSSFMIRKSTITTVGGALYGVSVNGVLSSALFEISESTIAGDQRAALTFDSRLITTVTSQGLDSVINITSNVISVRATTATLNTGTALPSQYVMGFLDPPSAAPATGSFLRLGTLLAIAANTFTFPGGALNYPLIYCYSVGAMVTHDGSNKGTGGRLHFIAGSASTSTAVIGYQLVLRSYTNQQSIIINHAAPLTNPSVLIESSATTDLTINGNFAVTGGNVMIASSVTVSATLTIGGHVYTNGRTVVEGTTIPSSGTFAITYSRISGGVVEVRSVNAPTLSFACPLEAAATFMVRDSTMTTGGFSYSGVLDGASLLHVEGNFITDTASNALIVSGTVTGASSVTIVGNKLNAAALASMYAIYLPCTCSNGKFFIHNNDAYTGVYKGGFYLTGVFSGADTTLVMGANLFEPSMATSNYIFYVPSWARNARFIHYNTNRYYGSRPFHFGFNNQGGVGVAQSLYVYLMVYSSAVNTFTFSGMTTNVDTDYQNSVVAVVSTSMSGQCTVTLPRTKNLNILFRSSSVNGAGLVLTNTYTYNTAFRFESATISNGVTAAGFYNGLTSVVFNSVTIPFGIRINPTFSTSSCTASATCLFAVWNTAMSGKLTLLPFSGTLGDYIHIDIFKCNFNTNQGGAWDVITFKSGQPSGRSTLSIVETKLYCRDSNIFQDDSYSLRMDTPMWGGVEFWGSEFHGDGIKATWSSGSMLYMHLFKNRIEQGSYGGSARGLGNSRQGCNWCDDFGCGSVGGGSVSGITSLSCSGTYTRCVMTSSFKRASYAQTMNVVAVGSCMVLPDIDAKISSGATTPTVSFAGTSYSYSTVTGSTFDNTISLATCNTRRDRLATLRTLFVFPTTSAGVMFGSVSTCGGTPATSFVPALTFTAAFTNPQNRWTATCQKPPLPETPTITLTRPLTLTSELTRSGVITVSKSGPGDTRSARLSGSKSLLLTLSGEITASSPLTNSAPITNSVALVKSASLSLAVTNSHPQVLTPSKQLTNSEHISASDHISDSHPVQFTHSGHAPTHSAAGGNRTNSVPLNGTSSKEREPTPSDALPLTFSDHIAGTVSHHVHRQTSTLSLRRPHTMTIVMEETTTTTTAAETEITTATTDGTQITSTSSTSGETSDGGNTNTTTVLTSLATTAPSDASSADTATTRDDSGNSTFTTTNEMPTLPTSSYGPSSSSTEFPSSSYGPTNVTAFTTSEVTVQPSTSSSGTTSDAVTTTALPPSNNNTTSDDPSTATPSNAMTTTSFPSGLTTTTANATTGPTTLTPVTTTADPSHGGCVAVTASATAQLRFANLTAYTDDFKVNADHSSLTTTTLTAQFCSGGANTFGDGGQFPTPATTAIDYRSIPSWTSTFDLVTRPSGDAAGHGLVMTVSASMHWADGNCLALSMDVPPSQLHLFDEGVVGNMSAGDATRYGFCPASDPTTDSNAFAAFGGAALLQLTILAADQRPSGASPDDNHGAAPSRHYNSTAFTGLGFALFDAQSIAVMSQSRCAPSPQQGRFRNTGLINPVTLWEDKDREGGASGAVVGIIVVMAALGAVFFTAALIRGMVLHSSGRYYDDTQGIVPTPLWTLTKRSLAHFGFGLWCIVLLALHPGAVFVSIRLIAGGGSDAGLGVVGVLLLLAVPLLAMPAFIRAFVTSAWFPLKANVTAATIRKARLDLSGGAGMVTKAQFMNGSRATLTKTQATLDDEDKGDGYATIISVRLTQFSSFMLSPVGLYRTQEVGEALGPLVSWRVKQPALWALLPFASALINAVLLGAYGDGGDNGSSTCTGLYAASAVLHAVLVAVVVVVRPYTLRAQNVMAVAVLLVTVAALAVSAAAAHAFSEEGEPSLDDADTRIDTYLTILEALLCLQSILTLLRLVLELWVLYFSSSFKQAVAACVSSEFEWRVVGWRDSRGHHMRRPSGESKDAAGDGLYCEEDKEMGLLLDDNEQSLFLSNKVVKMNSKKYCKSSGAVGSGAANGSRNRGQSMAALGQSSAVRGDTAAITIMGGDDDDFEDFSVNGDPASMLVVGSYQPPSVGGMLPKPSTASVDFNASDDDNDSFASDSFASSGSSFGDEGTPKKQKVKQAAKKKQQPAAAVAVTGGKQPAMAPSARSRDSFNSSTRNGGSGFGSSSFSSASSSFGSDGESPKAAESRQLIGSGGSAKPAVPMREGSGKEQQREDSGSSFASSSSSDSSGFSSES